MKRFAMVGAVALAPVLLLAVPSATIAVPVARAESAARFISLDGAQNFRDVGGYRTASGRMVKHGRLFRSGTLGRLTPAGQARFDSLRSVAIIDLRTTSERRSDQVAAWLQSRRGYWAREYGRSEGDLGRALGDTSRFTAARMRAMMTGAYRTMYKEQAPAYRVLFAQLLSANGPVVVNCTAGKDRTGIAVALVLTALGVPYATVRDEFLLSNAGIDPARLQGTISGPFAKLPPDVLAPMLSVDGQYLDAAFDQIRKDHGSVETFLEKELGVGPRQISRLRRRMLT